MFIRSKNRRIEKKIEVLRKKHAPSSLTSLSSVGIIADINELKNHKDLSFLKNAFKNYKGEEIGFGEVDVQTIVVPLRKKNADIIYTDKVFDEELIDRKGEFKIENDAREFQEKSFDLLINYYSKPSLQLLLLSASVKAKLKVGLETTGGKLNDIEIKVPSAEIEQFVEELKKFLPKIN